MPDGADTTRDAVAAAYKEVVSRSEPATAPEPAAEPAPEPAAAATPASEPESGEPSKTEPKRDGKGRFIVPPKAKPAASEKVPASTAPAGTGGAVSVPPPVVGAAPPVSPALEALKPPQSLRAMAREKWGTWPREAQEEYVRLQHEASRTLAESVATKKAWESHQQVISPYEGMIRAEGLEPAQAVGFLLQREAALRTAPMQTRAQIIAHGIRTFLGTDEQAIKLLADALDTSPQQGQPRAPQQQFDPNQIIAQAEQRLMQRLTTARNESVTTSAESEVETFRASHEFMDEPDPETGLTVAEDMANLMAAGISRDKAMSFDDAYKLAIKRHSVANKIVSQREAAKAATARAATTQASRAASSSIKSEPSGPTNGKPKDVRESVAQAYYAQKNAH